ncbi:MAG: hypothetical protein GTO46_16355 [Gemmatimonadetes bacterium]|nr:hypothetical protein [Gemmatimonadota bacterium]NIO33280.1 hypothetical protein [Gemmatimonadota bacterium]
MPSESDPRVEEALRALADPLETYRSAVVTTVEEVRGYLSARQSKGEERDGGVVAGLGVFAAGRIDFERFASLTTSAALEDDPDTLGKVEKAYDILRAIASGGDDAFCVKVKPGSRLRDAVAGRLAEIGRGFAAARLAGLARAGSLNSKNEDKLLAPLGFERWNQAERRLAPPIVVELEGADLHAGDLAEFLDGNVKIILVVTGDAAPAPLVRLITPSTFVLQTAAGAGLARFAASEGPAVAALMPKSAAQFVHDPAAGSSAADRLELVSVPERAPKEPVGGMSVRQQLDELEQLKSLAGGPSADGEAEEATAPTAGPVATKVDKLAAWLLSQADLSDVG